MLINSFGLSLIQPDRRDQLSWALAFHLRRPKFAPRAATSSGFSDGVALLGWRLRRATGRILENAPEGKTPG
jgi:hypothetical protein